MIKLLNRKKENGEVKTELKTIKRPTIVVLIALCIIVLITITLLLLNPGSAGDGDDRLQSGDKVRASDDPPVETPTVEILPDSGRVVPEKDPFGSDAGISVGRIRLTGILRGDDGRTTAIFTDGSSSYIVGIDEDVGDSGWSLAEISGDSAILTDGEQRIVVGFEGRE